MAVVVVVGGAHCRAEEVVHDLVRRTGWRRIENEVYVDTSSRTGVAVEKLRRAVTGPPPLLDRITGERAKLVAELRLTLAQYAVGDGLVIPDPVGLLLPRTLPHVLRVLIIANFSHRVQTAVRALNCTVRTAEQILHREDGKLAQWTQLSLNRQPWDDSLWDLVIPMHERTPGQAADLIVENASKDAVRADPQALELARDNLLAAQVNLHLARHGHDVEVSASGGRVTVLINRYRKRLEGHQAELRRLAAQVSGVKETVVKPGPRYTPPSILPSAELEMPFKALLVDDEREFVQTLSERLETRNLPSAVVYDGEQALSYVDQKEPEVIVLDLKMPGIDGIEVLRRVKRLHPDVEVIILTGHGSERERELAMELGAFAYLEKPADIELLARTMREAYQKAMVNRRNRGIC